MSSAARAPGRDQPAPSLAAHPVLEIARDIKISHSVFALPFAALGAVYAAVHAGAPSQPALLAGLILACMVSARTAAMIANRVLDRRLDALNPRTAGRALPSGRLTLRAALVGYGAASAAFILSAALLGVLCGNWWPLALALPVLAWISAYGLLKRFTLLCHLWLGASLAISPPAAALAVDPSSLSTPAPWLMCGMVLFWVAGFDIIYALQDVAVDTRDGLHSAPSRLGVPGAMWLSRALHAAALACLALLWAFVPGLQGPLFGAAVLAAAALLLAEHLTVHLWGTRRIAATFTLVNGALSLAVGAAGVASLLSSHPR